MKLAKPHKSPDILNDAAAAAFVSSTPMERALGLGAQVPSNPKPLVTEPELNPRIMKQVNIDMPEPEHYRLKRLIDAMPKMSMRKFILEAIAEKMVRVGAQR